MGSDYDRQLISQYNHIHSSLGSVLKSLAALEKGFIVIVAFQGVIFAAILLLVII